nr:transcriptional regulator BetI [Nitrincola sp. A-D6]
MPIVGVKDTRKQQLIQATLESIAELGLQNTTIITISRRAGMSSGIISHYFGGKQGLIEAALRYLLEQLGQDFRARIKSSDSSPEQRLTSIIEANFTDFQRSDLAARTWLSFWARSMHEPGSSACSRSTMHVFTVIYAMRLPCDYRNKLRQKPHDRPPP